MLSLYYEGIAENEVMENPEKLELVNEFAKETKILDLYDTVKKSRRRNFSITKRSESMLRRSLPGVKQASFFNTTARSSPAPPPPPPLPPPPPPPPTMHSSLKVRNSALKLLGS